MMSLKIKKRGGDDSSFNPQKIYNRIKRASKGLSVNSDEIFIKVITSVPTEGIITTKELDKLIYEIAAAFTGSHHDYSRYCFIKFEFIPISETGSDSVINSFSISRAESRISLILFSLGLFST